MDRLGEGITYHLVTLGLARRGEIRYCFSATVFPVYLYVFTVLFTKGPFNLNLF